MDNITAWMQGYATALEMTNARTHIAQIRQIRKDYGYANDGERRTSQRILAGVTAREVSTCG